MALEVVREAEVVVAVGALEEGAEAEVCEAVVVRSYSGCCIRLRVLIYY